MINRKNVVERRTHNRFDVPVGTYVALRPDYVKVGQMADISIDGLAFYYVDADEKSAAAAPELDILMFDRPFHLYQISCRIISDVRAYQSPQGLTTSMRRCGLQFGGLTAYQSGRLEYFIEKHARKRQR